MKQKIPLRIKLIFTCLAIQVLLVLGLTIFLSTSTACAEEFECEGKSGGNYSCAMNEYQYEKLRSLIGSEVVFGYGNSRGYTHFLSGTLEEVDRNNGWCRITNRRIVGIFDETEETVVYEVQYGQIMRKKVFSEKIK